MKKQISKEVKILLPTEEAFNNWREILYFSSGIAFTLDVVKAAYFMDIGYRAGMNKFSQMSFTISKDDPWNSAVAAYWDYDTSWTEKMHTDIIGSLLNRCCLIQFGMEHPKFGDPDSYKEKFTELTDKYNATNKFDMTNIKIELK